MRLPKPVVLGLVVALGAGCASDPARPAPPTPSASSPHAVLSLPADPAAALAAVAAQLDREPVRFTIAVGDQTQQSGVVDGPEHWEVSTESYVIRRLGPAMYFQLRGSAKDELVSDLYDEKVGSKWIHGRPPAGSELTVTFRHDFPYEWANAAAKGTGITKSGDHSFSGNMAAPASDGGTRPRRFTADLDAGNQLADLQIYDDTSDIGPLKLTYTAYPGPELTAPPASELADLSDDDYTAFLTVLPYS